MPVHIAETVVVPMLTRMRLPRHVMLDLLTQIGGERANVAPHEPSNVVGFETWRWGTRFLREEKTIKTLGWLQCDSDQVAGIRHPDLKIKLVCCGMDANTGNPIKDPINLSERGSNSRKLIGKNFKGQGSLFDPDDKDEEPSDDLWYYCCHFCDKFMSLELSRPILEIGGFVADFSDRIIIAQPGEIPGIRRFSVPQDFADVPKPEVRRK